MIYTSFDPETGKILIVSSCMPNSTQYLPGIVVEGEFLPNEYWFDDLEPTLRPFIFDGSSIELLSGQSCVFNAPIGTEVVISQQKDRRSINHMSGTVDDNSGVFFNSGVPGEYFINLMPPHPYRQQTVKVIVNAA